MFGLKRVARGEEALVRHAGVRIGLPVGERDQVGAGKAERVPPLCGIARDQAGECVLGLLDHVRLAEDRVHACEPGRDRRHLLTDPVDRLPR